MAANTDRGKLSLALVFGGRSGEHAVSIVSARSVHRALDASRYSVLPMAIDRRGLWADADTAMRVLTESTDRTDDVVHFEGRHRLDPRLLDGTLDVAFPVLHGPYGEDGTIQGLFDMLDLPYVGCDTASSALCMDKIFCKRALAHCGFATPPWVEIHRADWELSEERVLETCLALEPPLFVKPARLGSSVGISKVTDRGQLSSAVDTALSYGPRALAERGLDAREIEVAVLGGPSPRAALPGEVVPGHEFYDYDDKYVDSACQLLAPAPLDGPTSQRARELAIKVFSSLGCSGMARVDLFLERDGRDFWVNEVNTIPGFTSISMYPRLWEVSGLPYPTLVDELIRLAMNRT